MKELCVADKTTQNPTAADITAAIDATPHGDDDWFINLDADDGSYIEATAQAGGGYQLVSMAQKRRYNAAAPVDAAQLKTILIKYLNGDAGWRAECSWKAAQSDTATPVAARDSSNPPTWAMIIIVATIGFVVLTFNSSWLRSILPFGNSDYFYVGLIALPIVTVVVLMIIVKMREARNAATWPQTTAKILKSGMEARHHQHAGEATTITNVPAVEYEFTANGRKWRGNRISIGEDTGGAHSEATLARFPAGATVPVYYDPADPSHCVLIRDIPKGAGKGCAIILLVIAAIGGGLYFFAGTAFQYLQTHLPNSEAAPVVIFATCFGLALLLFFFSFRKMAKKAASWPSVRGRIVSSGVDSFQETEDGRTRTLYTAAVEYAYQVHGVEYHSRQINLGMTTSGSQAGAEKVAARYPQGAQVNVHYEPENPSNAALENPTGYTWLILGAALFCFIIAAYAAGLLKNNAILSFN